MRMILILLLLLGNICIGQYRSLPSYEPIRTYSGQRIWDIVNVPEEKVDIGLWALIIANEYDPSIGINLYLKKLDHMSEEITRMLAGRHSDLEILLAVRMFQFDEGIWNDNYPFHYDLVVPEKVYNDNINNVLCKDK